MKVLSPSVLQLVSGQYNFINKKAFHSIKLEKGTEFTLLTIGSYSYNFCSKTGTLIQMHRGNTMVDHHSNKEYVEIYEISLNIFNTWTPIKRGN